MNRNRGESSMQRGQDVNNQNPVLLPLVSAGIVFRPLERPATEVVWVLLEAGLERLDPSGEADEDVLALFAELEQTVDPGDVFLEVRSATASRLRPPAKESVSHIDKERLDDRADVRRQEVQRGLVAICSSLDTRLPTSERTFLRSLLQSSDRSDYRLSSRPSW